MYHESFRNAVLSLYHYFGSMRRTASVLKVSVASISRWARYADEGCPIASKVRQSRRSLITDAIRASVTLFLRHKTCLSSVEVVDHIRHTFGVSVSRQLAHLVIRSSGFTFKRTRKRGHSDRKAAATPPFLASFSVACASGKLVAIDESGFDQRPSPAYGYSAAGTPAIVRWKPSSDRSRLNLLMAVHASGSSVHTIQATTINGAAFAEFIRGLPFDRETTLLLDNASIHKTPAVRQAMAEKGFDPLFLPPYSPEFNPIELVFGVIKNAFYRLRYSDGFSSLLGATKRCVAEKATPSTIRGCFGHVERLIASESATKGTGVRPVV